MRWPLNNMKLYGVECTDESEAMEIGTADAGNKYKQKRDLSTT